MGCKNIVICAVYFNNQYNITCKIAVVNRWECRIHEVIAIHFAVECACIACVLFKTVHPQASHEPTPNPPFGIITLLREDVFDCDSDFAKHIRRGHTQTHTETHRQTDHNWKCVSCVNTTLIECDLLNSYRGRENIYVECASVCAQNSVPIVMALT